MGSTSGLSVDTKLHILLLACEGTLFVQAVEATEYVAFVTEARRSSGFSLARELMWFLLCRLFFCCRA